MKSAPFDAGQPEFSIQPGFSGMDAVLWGLATALGWGIADFFARYTARGFGTLFSVAAMLLTSSLILTVMVTFQNGVIAWHWGSLHFLLLGSLGVVLGTSLLYRGLARGPVSLVATIMASYPAFNLVLAVALGIAISLGQWVLMALVMAGVVTVSKASKGIDSPERHNAKELTTTITIAVVSALSMAVGLAGLQLAAQHYGEWGTLLFSRWAGALLALMAILVCRPAMPAFNSRLAGILVLQGLLDGGAYLSLLYGSHGAGMAIVVVVASCFTVVTLVLARIFLKERMGVMQRLGILMVIGGVTGLAYLGVK